MKKLLIGLLMAVLLPLGFVGATAAPSSAIDCNNPPYTGCVIGKLRVNKFNKVRFNEKNTIRVRVTVPGNRDVRGTINLRYKRKGGGASYTFPARPYNNAALFYKTPRLKVPGRYKIIATFTAAAPFSDLKNAKKTFVVKPKGFRG